MIPLRNLRRNSRRQIATGIALASGFCAALLLNSYANSYLHYLKVYTLYSSHTGHFVIYQNGGAENIRLKPKLYRLSESTQNEVNEILKDDGAVAKFGAQLSTVGMIGNGVTSIPFYGTALEPEVMAWTEKQANLNLWSPATQSPEKETKKISDYPESLAPITLGIKLAEALNKTRSHDEILQSSHNSSEDANVQLLAGNEHGSIGIADGEIIAYTRSGSEQTDRFSVSLGLPLMQKLLDTSRVDRISVWLKNETDFDQEIQNLRKKFREKNIPVDVLAWNDEKISPLYTGTTNFLITLMAFAGTVLGALVVLSVFSTITITVLERRREIGIFKAMGYPSRRIINFFLVEHAILVGLAVTAGLIFGLGLIDLINLLQLPFNPPGIGLKIALCLVPNFSYAFFTGCGFLVITHLTIWFAVKSKTREAIPELLDRVSR